MIVFKHHVFQTDLIGPTPMWVCVYPVDQVPCWMHTSSTLRGLIWSLITEYKHDSNLVGY